MLEFILDPKKPHVCNVLSFLYGGKDVPEIKKTTDYEMFKFFSCNRPVKKQRLVKSIQEGNFLYNTPIIVNGNFFVVDGQHRLAAAKILNLPIYYIVDHNLTEKDIGLFNIHQDSWDIGDYMHYYKELKVPDYIFASSLHEKYKLPLHFIVYGILGATRDAYKIFKTGEMVLKDHAKINESFRIFNESYRLCNEICSLKKGIFSKGMRALWFFTNNKKYVHARFLDKCNRHKDVVLATFGFKDQENVRLGLEKLYNYCNKSKPVSFAS